MHKQNKIESQARFIRRISVASNAIQTIDNETAYLIIYCLNCIRRDGNSTYKTRQNEIAIPDDLTALALNRVFTFFAEIWLTWMFFPSQIQVSLTYSSS